MSRIVYVLIIPCVILGLVINSLGVISLYRFKDVYMRMHGATKCSTLGTILVSVAVIAYSIVKISATGEMRFAVLIIHIVFALFGLLIGNSTSAHVLSRAAYRAGIKPKYAVIDDYSEYCAKELAEESAERAAAREAVAEAEAKAEEAE